MEHIYMRIPVGKWSIYLCFWYKRICFFLSASFCISAI